MAEKQSTKVRMTEEQKTKFVRLYKNHENLWNVFLPEYRNRESRNASLQDLVREMNLTNFTTKDVAKKVKSLRCTYHLEVAKILKSKRSGGGTDFAYEPRLPWFIDMDHIMKMIKTQSLEETNSNLEAPVIEFIQINNSDEDTIINEHGNAENESVDSELLTNVESKRKSNNTPKSTKKTAGTINAVIKELKDLQKLLSAPSPTLITPTTIIEDECDIMGKHIAVQLRMLPEHIRLRANLEIHSILMNFRMEHMNSRSTEAARSSSDHTYSTSDSINTQPCLIFDTDTNVEGSLPLN